MRVISSLREACSAASRRTIVFAVFLVAACGTSDKKGADEALCMDACNHTMELALADIDKNMAALGDPAMTEKVRAQLEDRRDSDLKTCLQHCKAGRLDAKCALAARTIDGALSCTSSAEGGATGKTPVEPPEERTDEEWPSAPLREVSDSVGGVGFTLRIPTELQEQEADRSDTARGWDFPDQPFSQPRFRVTLLDSFVKTVEEGLVYYDPDEDETVLRKEHTGERFVLLVESATFVVARVVAKAGDKGVECYGTHSGRNLTRPDEIGAWLVEVCSTLAVK